MIKSIMFDEMNSRAQVQLIVMQNQPDKNLKWVLVYQDHLKILHKKLIIDYLTYLAYLHIQFNVRWFNPLSAKLIKWSNTLKQFVGKLPTNCLSVFDHFLGLALKGLKIKHIKLRHSQKQALVKRTNKDFEDIGYTLIEQFIVV